MFCDYCGEELDEDDDGYDGLHGDVYCQNCVDNGEAEHHEAELR